VAPGGGKLLVIAAEAERVRTIYELYRDLGSLGPTLDVLRLRGWKKKAWTGRQGQPLGGSDFAKPTLHLLLTNPVYIGKVHYKTELHPGEHEAIVPSDLFDAVQQRLQANGRVKRAPSSGASDALLQGLVCCTPCGLAMSPSHTTRPDGRRYR
jgi:site-specific DNA recombinase